MSTPARLALAAAALALLMAVPPLLGAYNTSLAVEILVFALLAMSVDILAGFAGRTPLCHGAIFGIAAYVVLYEVTVAGAPLWLAVLLGIAAAMLTAAVFALLAVRTSGVYFLLLTLALGMIVWGICNRWTSVTGGENGLRGTVRPGWLADTVSLYYFTLAAFAALAFLMWRLVNSPFGLTLKGIRESETRMQALGYNVPLHLFMGFVASGFFAGAAGVLYAFFNAFVSPSTVDLRQSVEVLLMAIIGGIGTLFGSLLGALLVVVVENVASVYTERWSMLLGLLFIVTMIFAPDGILGMLQNVTRRRGPRPAAAPDSRRGLEGR